MTKRGTKALDRRIGARLRAARLAKGLSQQELGSRLGVTFQQIQKYERGTNRIAASRLCEVAAILGIEATDLLDSGPAQGSEALSLPTDRAGIILAEAAARLPPSLRAALARLAVRMATCLPR